MVVGIWINVLALVYQSRPLVPWFGPAQRAGASAAAIKENAAVGGPCIVQRTDAFLALGMYASYFVLFTKLYYDHYIAPNAVAVAAGEQAAGGKAGDKAGMRGKSAPAGKKQD